MTIRSRSTRSVRTFLTAAGAFLVLFTGLAARGETLAAFDGRCILGGCVAPPSNTRGILGRRALPARRLARLGATPDFHHGLLAADRTQTGKAAEPAWQPLFDGKTLANWKPTKFIGEREVKVENGQLILEAGNPLTGITYTGPELPTTNYEIALQAMRVEGRDFFAGVTFPVDASFCSLVLGGWGGTVVGLSSINGMDASENDTSQSIEFESGRWYSIRVRVTPAKIEAWLDERQIVNQDLKGNKVETRIEVDPSQPLGVATFRTKSALRDIRLRRL